MTGEFVAVPNRLRTVILGSEEPRLRATWRFLLAWPLLPLVGAVVAVVMPLLGVSGMIPGGPLQGLVFLCLLLAWAGVVDRRPLSDYGVSATRSWLTTLVVGFVAVLLVWSGWHVLAASVGLTRLELVTTGSTGALAASLLGTLGSLLVNTLVQDLVFFAIVLKGAAEGFRARGLAPRRAVLGGWLVGVLFFTVIHGLEGPVDVLAHAVGGAVFGLLYVHTGELALTVGVHWGSSWAAGHLFPPSGAPEALPSLFRVTEVEPGVRGFLVAIPLYLCTYLLLVGWLRWRRGTVSLQPGLAEWKRRRQGGARGS